MTDSEHPSSPTHCISCGTEVPDHAKFCQACGSAVYRPEDTSQPSEPAPFESLVPEATIDPTSEVTPVQVEQGIADSEALENCINCGAELTTDRWCHACGADVYRPEDESRQSESAAAEAPVPDAETNLIAEGLSPELSAKGGKGFTFFEAVGSGFSNYAVFSGRASRSEYWYWFLFTFIGGIVALLIHPALYFMGFLATLLPTLAVAARRLHDVGRSGWWYFSWFVPILGPILMLYWMCKRGDVGENRYDLPVIPAPQSVTKPVLTESVWTEPVWTGRYNDNPGDKG